MKKIRFATFAMIAFGGMIMAMDQESNESVQRFVYTIVSESVSIKFPPLESAPDEEYSEYGGETLYGFCEPVGLGNNEHFRFIVYGQSDPKLVRVLCAQRVPTTGLEDIAQACSENEEDVTAVIRALATESGIYINKDLFFEVEKYTSVRQLVTWLKNTLREFQQEG